MFVVPQYLSSIKVEHELVSTRSNQINPWTIPGGCLREWQAAQGVDSHCHCWFCSKIKHGKGEGKMASHSLCDQLHVSIRLTGLQAVRDQKAGGL